MTHIFTKQNISHDRHGDHLDIYLYLYLDQSSPCVQVQLSPTIHTIVISIYIDRSIHQATYHTYMKLIKHLLSSHISKRYTRLNKRSTDLSRSIEVIIAIINCTIMLFILIDGKILFPYNYNMIITIINITRIHCTIIYI